jgi:hypothetical protein
VETAELALIEALADPRIAGDDRSLPVDELEGELVALLPGASWTGLERQGLVERWGASVQLVVDGETTLDEQRCARPTGLAGTPDHGELLAAFAEHCRELDGVDVLEESPCRLAFGSNGEPAKLELRASLLFCDRLGRDVPTLVLSELTAEVVERFTSNEDLRGRVAVYDLERLEKVDALGPSSFGPLGHFESFLRDPYGASMREHSSLHRLAETRRSQ